MVKRFFSARFLLWGIALLLALAACGPDLLAGLPTPAGNSGGTPGVLPDMPNKPKPAEITFKGCPPEGDGGDPVLNRLKNRVDDGNFVTVPFDAVEQLTWPKAIERKHHADWSAADAASIARYEGIPLSVEGYLAGAKEEGPETPNCHGADAEFHDFHIWLMKGVGDDRSRSIVVETTPRVKAKHAGWRSDVLNKVVQQKLHVRISGWLMFDPEHPDQVGQTRGTIWEIHPVMQIEVERQGQWSKLDDFAGQR